MTAHWNSPSTPVATGTVVTGPFRLGNSLFVSRRGELRDRTYLPRPPFYEQDEIPLWESRCRKWLQHAKPITKRVQ